MRTGWHPDREALGKLVGDELSAEESRRLQRHVFACPACEERLIELLPRSERASETAAPGGAEKPSAADREAGYRRLVRRVLDETGPEIERRRARLEAERVDAYEIWRELRRYNPEQRRALVTGDPRYRSWGFFELLIEKSRHAVLAEPQKAAEILRLALDVSDHLDAALYGPGSVAAAKARAWTYLGNALRVLSNFRRSEQAFQTAEAYLAQSWLDPLDEALLLELKSSLRRAQRRFDDALEMLDAAIALYREVNEPHLQGRALLAQGLVLQYSEHYEAACSSFRSSLFLLDGSEEPRLVVVAHYNLINCLYDSGRTAEAAALLPQARRLMEQAGSRSDLVRLRWLEGRIAVSTGRTAEAEQIFLDVREILIEDNIAFDVALVSFDLAALYARAGRFAEVKRLAGEMLPILRSCDLHDEVLAALIVFQQAADQEQLSLALVEEIAGFLERLRTNPALRFRSEDLPRDETGRS